NILVETDGSDVTQAIYSLGLALYGNLVSQRRGTASQYFHFDGLGSTDRLTDSTGTTVTDNYVYQAFGSIKSNSGTSVNPFRYVGQLGYYFNADLGQYLLRTRNYDPISGRFLTRDPLGFHFLRTGYLDSAVARFISRHPLLPRNFNLYSYVASTPTLLTDPSGLLVPPVALAAPAVAPVVVSFGAGLVVIFAAVVIVAG